METNVKKKMGRPPKTGETRSEPFSAKFTPAEKELMAELASELKLSKVEMLLYGMRLIKEELKKKSS